MASLAFFTPLPTASMARFSAFDDLMQITGGFVSTSGANTSALETGIVALSVLLLVPLLVVILRPGL